MSEWGHIAGMIRIARDPYKSAKQKTILKKIFDSNVNKSSEEVHKNLFPCGSEGPAKSKIITYEWEYAIALNGDLRGFGKNAFQYTKLWWKNIEKQLKANDMQILQSVLNVKLDCEDNINLLTHHSSLFGEKND